MRRIVATHTVVYAAILMATVPVFASETASHRFVNLALEGGGVWGIGHVGALQVLEDRDVLSGVQRVAGTSAGAVVGMLVCLDYSPGEVKGIVEGMDFARFMDDEPEPEMQDILRPLDEVKSMVVDLQRVQDNLNKLVDELRKIKILGVGLDVDGLLSHYDLDIRGKLDKYDVDMDATLAEHGLDRERLTGALRLVLYYGYYKGDYALDFLERQVEQRLGSRQATFSDLMKWGGRDLRVFVTNLSTCRVQELSYSKSPDMAIAKAVRASMAFPLLFTAVNQDNQILVDGGVLMNYPLESFATADANETLGIAFSESDTTPGQDPQINAFGYRDPVEYFWSLSRTISRAQATAWVIKEDMRRRTILIDTAGLSGMDVNLTDTQKQQLYQNGVAAAEAFFAGQTAAR